MTYIGEDGDATNKNPVEFSIESASVDGLFAVEQSSGILTTIEYIDAESLPEDIELTIKVSNVVHWKMDFCHRCIKFTVMACINSYFRHSLVLYLISFIDP